MKKVAVVTDTTACVTQEQVKEYGIEQVPQVIVFGDKVYRDGTDISPAEFYALLRQAEQLPTTSHPSPEDFLEVYRDAGQRAASILCITVAAKFSATFNSARVAVEMAQESMPGVNIEVLDSNTAAAAQGLVVLAAARAAVEGKSLPDVIGAARGVMARVNLIATLNTLRYLVKGGRVPKAAAFLGTILQIKPIFGVTDGEASPVTKARSIDGALKRILKFMEDRAVSGKPLHAAVMHADALDRTQAFREQIASRFQCAELFITEFTPVMGVHTGPGVIGVAFYSGD